MPCPGVFPGCIRAYVTYFYKIPVRRYEEKLIQKCLIQSQKKYTFTHKRCTSEFSYVSLKYIQYIPEVCLAAEVNGYPALVGRLWYDVDSCTIQL